MHEVTVRNGVQVERHLCEAHAAEHGIAVNPTQPIGEILKQVLGAPGAVAAAKLRACPACKTTFSEFKQHGLLGCAECYKMYEGPLGPLLERAHDGGTAHVGKVPRRMTKTPRADEMRQTLVDLEARAERLRRIREELEKAVKTEQYEHAARLRDELKKLAGPEGGA